MLADDARSVLGHVHPRKADSFHSGNFGEEGVVAASDLGAALDHVPGNDATGQGVEVVGTPAVAPGGGPTDEGRVSHPSGDDNVGALIQCFDDPEASEV